MLKKVSLKRSCSNCKRTFSVCLSVSWFGPDESASSARPGPARLGSAWVPQGLARSVNKARSCVYGAFNNPQRVCTCRPPYKTPTTDKNGFSSDVYLHWSVLDSFLLYRWLQLRNWPVRLRCSGQSSGYVSGLSHRLLSHSPRQKHFSPPSSRQQLVTKQHTSGWNVTAARCAATSLSVRTGYSLSHDRDQPITAECVEHRGRRLLFTSPWKRRSSKYRFKQFVNKKLNSAFYTQ